MEGHSTGCGQDLLGICVRPDCNQPSRVVINTYEPDGQLRQLGLCHAHLLDTVVIRGLDGKPQVTSYRSQDIEG